MRRSWSLSWDSVRCCQCFSQEVTKCGGNHDDIVFSKVGDELTAKAGEMKKQTEEIEEQATVILSKRKNRPNNKVTSSEIKTYSAGLNVNKDIEECVPLVPSIQSLPLLLLLLFKPARVKIYIYHFLYSYIMDS